MKSVLVSGLELALARLQAAIDDPNLPNWLETAFGSGWELANAKELIGKVAISRALPKISVVAASEINGGKAAFDNNTNEIYVSQEFLTANEGNSDIVAGILLEELGHYFDRQLNSQDSPGDEGAIFAALVQGKTLSVAELGSLKAENDRTTAVIDGTVRELELAGPYGNIAVDGNLADWSANDRIDFLPGTAAANHEVYGKFVADATNGDNYLVAIKSDREIGVGSSIWLNTDRNATTGYQIFGNTGGAEYHIQVTGVSVDASGNRTVTAALYTGAEGQTPVPITGASNIDYKLSADGKSLEVAIPTSLLGTTAPVNGIDVLADINNAVYLPGSYNNPNQLTITKQSFTPKNTYGGVTLDGNLTDWQTRDRLDTAGSLAAGYAVYGKNTTDGYVIGIESAQAISTGTTVWLNTDNNAATGYQIFANTPNSGGAEYNVNFGSDGKAYLYSGAEGQTLVSKVDYALSADGKKLELGLNKNIIPTAANGISVFADVNNNAFLPTSFATPYRISNSTAASRNTYGNITLDGSVSDWTNANRLDLGSSTAGYALYGKNTTDGYTLAITSAQAIGANTTVWIDADRNAATGYQIFGNSGGAEYNVNIDSVDANGNAKASLYSGAAGQNLIGQVDAKLSADKKTIEFGIDRTLMTTSAEGIKVLADVNDTVYLPGSYSAGGLNVSSSTAAAPTRTDTSKKVGIVFSETSAAKFFDRKAYSQLFTNAQNQAMQAGVTFDLLTEADLKDLTKIVNYDSLVFPSFTNVNKNDLATIESNLLQASYQYGVGLITSGEFMTNDETGAALAGDPYARMKSLFDVTRTNGLPTADIALKVKDTAGGILQASYAPGEQIASYSATSGLPVSVYSTVSKPGTILAEQTAGGQNYNAVIATQTGGRNLHFANPSFFADSNIGWQGLDWSVFGNQAKVGLDMTRNTSMFISRDDVDQSRFSAEAPAMEAKLGTILTEWKQRYNFVGSHYINVGNNPAAGESTDWNVMRPIYQKWLALGNEIGTHSYTHPEFTSTLTAAQLEFEFNQSAQIIRRELGVPVNGTATPGNPESLFVDQEISKYFQYISGVGTSYNNAFGFLTPDSKTVYFAPNLSFDFTLVEFNKFTAAQAEAQWTKEYNQLTKSGNKPFLEFSWHDYAVTESPTTPGYTRAMFENFIARAYKDGTEFITMDDAQQRIRAFDAAKVTTNQVGNTITANVLANNIGNFALSVAQPGAKIQNVSNYFAYNDNAVFMTKTGGNFTINLGTTSDDVSHIVALDQRNELIAVTGDGTNLDFTFKGDGTVKLDAKAITADQRYRVTGADSYTVTGDKLDLKFTGNTEHIVKLQVVADTAPTVAVPLTAVTETANIATNRVIDLSKTFTDIDKDAISLSVVGNTNANLLGTALNGTNLTLQYNDNYVYGNSTITVRATAGGKSVDTSFNVTLNPTNAQINGTDVANTLNGTANSEIIKGFGGNDTINGGGGNDIEIGGTGSDQLFGGAGNDVLIGVDNLNLLTPGRGEYDFLQGNAGADRFVLGSKTAIYYNDGNNSNNGRNDFAAISDFNAAQGDVIQLKGKAADYTVRLELSPTMTTFGMGIYNNTLGQPELIGFVNGATNLNLNSAAFAYV